MEQLSVLPDTGLAIQWWSTILKHDDRSNKEENGQEDHQCNASKDYIECPLYLTADGLRRTTMSCFDHR